MPEAKESLICDEMSQKIIDAVEEIAMEGGAATLTVTQILRKLDISNRVFYNRFPNIETVLDIVYRNTIVKIRSALESPVDVERDFFEYVKDVVSRSLLVSYDVKMKFNQYIFEEDSLGELNRTWWTDEIKKLIIFAKEHKLIKDVDEETLAYSIWCFCRATTPTPSRAVCRRKKPSQTSNTASPSCLKDLKSKFNISERYFL